jgi:hypothetical protein
VKVYPATAEAMRGVEGLRCWCVRQRVAGRDRRRLTS